MTRTIYKGYVEVEVDEERGVVWVNNNQGRCIIRICNVPRLAERLKGGSWNIDVRVLRLPEDASKL